MACQSACATEQSLSRGHVRTALALGAARGPPLSLSASSRTTLSHVTQQTCPGGLLITIPMIMGGLQVGLDELHSSEDQFLSFSSEYEAYHYEVSMSF